MRLDGSTLVLVYTLEHDVSLQTFPSLSACGTPHVLWADNASSARYPRSSRLHILLFPWDDLAGAGGIILAFSRGMFVN